MDQKNEWQHEWKQSSLLWMGWKNTEFYLMKEVSVKLISPALAVDKSPDWSNTSGQPLQAIGREVSPECDSALLSQMSDEMYLPLGVPNSLHWLSQWKKIYKKINAETVYRLQLARETKLGEFNLMLCFCIRMEWIAPWRHGCASEVPKDRAKGKLLCCLTNFLNEWKELRWILF